MRRLIALTVAAGLVIAAGATVWRWWTAPPRAREAALAAALSIAPEDADGALALAQPARCLRWLASHPASLAVLAIAAPSADRSLPRLRRLLAALAREAHGPITLWWRGGDVAAGATVGSGAAPALQRLAALEGLALQVQPRPGGNLVTAATAGTLLAPGWAPPRPEGFGSLAGVARIRGWWWRVHVARSRLELTSGEPPELPGATSLDMLATPDLAALLAGAGGTGWLPHAPASVRLDAGGWAVALPATALPTEVVRALSFGGRVAAGEPGGAYRCRGLLGEIWVRTGPGTALASRPDLLAELPAGLITGESGAVGGTDLARLCARFARACDSVPGGAALAAGLRRAVGPLEGLRRARWRLLPEGGHILLEW